MVAILAQDWIENSRTVAWLAVQVCKGRMWAGVFYSCNGSSMKLRDAPRPKNGDRTSGNLGQKCIIKAWFHVKAKPLGSVNRLHLLWMFKHLEAGSP